MKTEHKETAWKILRICLLFLCVLLIAVWLIQDPDALTRLLMEHTPQNPAVAALVILVLYLIKGLTVFFPLIVLEITAGYLFSPWAALPLNFAGILIVLTVPYWVGRAAGLNVIQKQMEKHPRFAKVLDRQQANSFFSVFSCVSSAVCPAMWLPCIWVQQKHHSGKIFWREVWAFCPGWFWPPSWGKAYSSRNLPCFGSAAD